MNWVVVDCRPEGVERLSIVDLDSKQVICRIENSVSGRPILGDDEQNADTITKCGNLRELLRKFLAYLERVEGSDFVDPHDLRAEARHDGIEFTDKEWALLQELHDENQEDG